MTEQNAAVPFLRTMRPQEDDLTTFQWHKGAPLFILIHR